MVMQIVGAILNIILDSIFIFGYFGLPAMGTKGAAIATVVGQIVAMLLGVYFNLTQNRDVQFDLKDFQLNGSYIKAICEVGIPTIIMQSMSSIMCFGINKLLLAFWSEQRADLHRSVQCRRTARGARQKGDPSLRSLLGADRADRDTDHGAFPRPADQRICPL